MNVAERQPQRGAQRLQAFPTLSEIVRTCSAFDGRKFKTQRKPRQRSNGILRDALQLSDDTDRAVRFRTTII
jgi:hypothetical protein